MSGRLPLPAFELKDLAKRQARELLDEHKRILPSLSPIQEKLIENMIAMGFAQGAVYAFTAGVNSVAQPARNLARDAGDSPPPAPAAEAAASAVRPSPSEGIHNAGLEITPYAGIICREHGKVDIDKAEFDRQMCKPNSLWRCPKCGNSAHFDDDRHESLQGIS